MLSADQHFSLGLIMRSNERTERPDQLLTFVFLNWRSSHFSFTPACLTGVWDIFGKKHSPTSWPYAWPHHLHSIFRLLWISSIAGEEAKRKKSCTTDVLCPFHLLSKSFQAAMAMHRDSPNQTAPSWALLPGMTPMASGRTQHRACWGTCSTSHFV